ETTDTEAPKKPARRRTTKKTEMPAAETTVESGEPTKPAPRRRRSTKKSDETSES
ncbi:MAG: RNA polymerase sigma factor, partial [Desulfuromonas sp.]